MLAQLWCYWLFLIATWSHVFLPNVYCKELSLMAKPGYAPYERRSGLMLPPIAAACELLLPRAGDAGTAVAVVGDE